MHLLETLSVCDWAPFGECGADQYAPEFTSKCSARGGTIHPAKEKA
jgi:hypothetical protein